MMELLTRMGDIFHVALQGGAATWLIALSLAAMTLLLEDVAIAAGAALATQGVIDWPLAFTAVAGGIALGDLGLYALGNASRSVPWLHRRYIAGKPLAVKGALESRLMSAVLLARVIPGLRLVTYTVCGFAKVHPLNFSVAVFAAVTTWTAGLFWLSASLGSVIAEHFHVSAPVAVALPIVVFALAFPVFRSVRARYQKAPT
jgi:membrane protein DedA with SNARE-associated domain